MMRTHGAAMLWILAVAGAIAWNPAYCGTEDLLDAEISLHLADAPADSLLHSFARLLSAELDMDTVGARPVTIDLDQVSVGSALDGICEQLDCYWELLPGDPPVLRVESTLSLELEEADLVQVLTLFAQILGLGVEVDPGLGGTLTIRLDTVPWSDALDGICESAGCRWSLDADGRRLRFETLDATAGTPVDVDLSGPQRARLPLLSVLHAAPEVLLRFHAPGASDPLVRQLALDWSRSISRVASDDGAQEVVTSWVRLGNRVDVLLPLLIDCERPPNLGPRVHALGPAVLRGADTWVQEHDGAVVELRQAVRRDAGRVPADPAEACVSWEPIRMNLAIDGAFNAQNEIGEPGQFLQVLLTPTPDRPASDLEAAVVVIDRDAAGRFELALLSLGEGDNVGLLRGSVALDDPWVTALTLSDGTTVDLELRIDETSAAR